MFYRRMLMAVWVILLLGGCGGAGKDGGGAVREEAEVVVDAGPAVSEECAGVEFENLTAVMTSFRNWALRYGVACAEVAAAHQRCGQLQAPAVEMLECMREGTASAQACPDAGRKAYVAAAEGMVLVDECRQERMDQVAAATREAIAGYSEVESGFAETIIRRCTRDNALDLASAVLCVRLTADAYVAERANEEAMLKASRAALAERAPAMAPPVVDAFARRCAGGAGEVDAAVDCVLGLVDAQESVAKAIAGLSESAAAAILQSCVDRGMVADRKLSIASPDCVAADAWAFAEVQANYDDVDTTRCIRSGRRWSQAFDCIRREWMTEVRVVAAKQAALDDVASRLPREYLRQPVVRYCNWRVGTSQRDVLRLVDMLPDEHAGAAVRRAVEECAEKEVVAFEALERMAGQKHDGVVEYCAGELKSSGHNWVRAAWCVRQAAKKAGDERFAGELAKCTRRSRILKDLVECTASADRAGGT